MSQCIVWKKHTAATNHLKEEFGEGVGRQRVQLRLSSDNGRTRKVWRGGNLALPKQRYKVLYRDLKNYNKYNKTIIK